MAGPDIKELIIEVEPETLQDAVKRAERKTDRIFHEIKVKAEEGIPARIAQLRQEYNLEKLKHVWPSNDD